MNKYILTIDQGTTSSRAIIFNEYGKVISVSQMEFSQICKHSGWVEHNPDEIWETVYQVIKGALNKANLLLKDITGIAIANQRETTVLWDKLTGKPVYNAIVWQSRQSQEICDRLIDAGYSDLIKEKTGLLINPYFSASKITWILEHVKEAKNLARENRLLFGTIDSFLVWKLTNGKVHVTDYSNASRTLLFNINTLSWDDELLKLFNVPKNILPKVVENSGIIGYAEKLIELDSSKHLIPIASLIGDQQAALFGQCCYDLGDAKSTYGTGCFILMNTKDKIIKSTKGLLSTIGWVINKEVTYALEGSVFVAGSAVQWLRDGLEFFPKSSDCEKYVKNYKSNNGVYVVPAFVGLGTPYWDNDVRGAIFGLTRATTKDHIISATLNSIALQAKDVMDVMVDDLGSKMVYLGVDGGTSVNNYLMQYQADLLDVKLTRPACLETTALGAAYLCGLALGVYENLESIKKFHNIEKVFMSNMDAEVREEIVDSWKMAVNATMKYKK